MLSFFKINFRNDLNWFHKSGFKEFFEFWNLNSILFSVFWNTFGIFIIPWSGLILLSKEHFGRKMGTFQEFGFKQFFWVEEFIFEIIFVIAKDLWNFSNTLVKPNLTKKRGFRQKKRNIPGIWLQILYMLMEHKVDIIWEDAWNFSNTLVGLIWPEKSI